MEVENQSACFILSYSLFLEQEKRIGIRSGLWRLAKLIMVQSYLHGSGGGEAS